MSIQRSILVLSLFVSVLVGAAYGVPQSRETTAYPLAWESFTVAGAEWFPTGEYQQATLIVVGPNGERQERCFLPGESVRFDSFESNWRPEGRYRYELRVTPQVDQELLEIVRKARREGDFEALEELRRADLLPEAARVESGGFTVRRGVFEALTKGWSRDRRRGVAPTGASSFLNEWLIDDSSGTHLEFFDFSDQAVVRFSEAATANALVVDANGLSVGTSGVGTSIPAKSLHLFEDDTPSIRFQQDAAGTIDDQTWDVGANELSFFVQDVTGSTVPFSIEAAAPDDAMTIDSDGNVGIGTANPSDDDRFATTGRVGIGATGPQSKLHVFGGDIRVSNGSFIYDGTHLNVPDYVFEPDYPLLSIAEVREFIQREKRLPNVPNVDEIQREGVNLSELQMKLLEKIEELTLYTLQQDETIRELEHKMGQRQTLQDRVELLESENGALKGLLMGLVHRLERLEEKSVSETEHQR